MLHPLDIGTTLGEGWQTFMRNAGALILGAILMVVGIIFTLGLGSGAMAIGYNRMCLRAARGESVAPGDVFQGFSHFVPGLLLMIIAGVAVSVGTMLCVVPGLVIGFGIYWAAWIMADGETDVMECLRRSWAFNMANIGPALLFLIVNTIINSIGGCVAVGTLITTPVAMAMAAHAYIRAFGGATVAERPAF
ncbi:MAG: hypothetical protein HZB16_18975 [Armatimonadetes bacterium]|nr:hypothetical protein [Armatimonadota bacterium]